MTLAAYVLIKTKKGTDKKVLETVGRLEGVESVQILEGRYDALVKTTADATCKLYEIENKIRGTDGIRSVHPSLLIVE